MKAEVRKKYNPMSVATALAKRTRLGSINSAPKPVWRPALEHFFTVALEFCRGLLSRQPSTLTRWQAYRSALQRLW
jgi:hypothetical protein